jgi:hypothetical protein
MTKPVSDVQVEGREGLCATCRHDPCACFTLCSGCDRLLDRSRYCPDCEEVMPTYLHPVAGQTDMTPFVASQHQFRTRHRLGRPSSHRSEAP